MTSARSVFLFLRRSRSPFAEPAPPSLLTSLESPGTHQQPYEEKATADKARYEKEKAAYDVRLSLSLTLAPRFSPLTDGAS